MSLFRKRAKSDSNTEYSCNIRFLDDTESISLTFKKDTLGQWLFDRVCEKLNLVEKDYFGLRYVDTENQRHWLDPLKTVYKQLKAINKMVLCFRVKFYPEDPMKLHEEITRYYLFLQLRRDLHHGRLLCPHDEAIQLAAYIIQSEVGDYDSQDHHPGYVGKFKMLPKQTPKHEEKITEAHKSLAGQVPSEAESAFLKKASAMDTYGVDPHQVKDQRGDQLYLGITHLGIMTFRGSRRTQLFKWSQIRKLSYEGKTFAVSHSSAEKQQAVGFKCLTAPAAKYLWRCAVEQQLFFTLSSSLIVPKIRSGGTLFSRGSKFRFSGRCQNEAYEASDSIRRTEPTFARTSSLPNFAKRNQANDNKNNTLQPNDSMKEERRKYNVYLATGKNRQEAAVDVPSTLVTSNGEQKLPKKAAAPLASQEALVEDSTGTPAVVAETMASVSATSPLLMSTPHKGNGQAALDKSGVLETSIDETEDLKYEPNRTLETSDDDEDAKKPELDEQIRLLDEEILKPNDLNVPPIVAKNRVPEKKSAGGGCCLKAMILSVFVMLVLFIAFFYIVFFSSIKHPLVPKLRQQLTFLEPVRDFLSDKTTKMVSYLKK